MYTQLSSILILSLVLGVNSFPDGAPIDACVKPRVNQPYHGQARPQPAESSPFQILQTSAEYGPGSQITGKRKKYFIFTAKFCSNLK